MNEGIEIGDEENDIPCACGPKVLVNYKCCEVTTEPILAIESKWELVKVKMSVELKGI